MSKHEKLLRRIQNLDQSLRYEELAKILKAYGYEPTETKGGSSHITFRKPNCYPITIPRHVPIGKKYIELVKNVVERGEQNE